MIDMAGGYTQESKGPGRRLAVVLAIVSPVWSMLYIGRGWRALAYAAFDLLGMVGKLDRSGWLTAIFAIALRLVGLLDVNSLMRAHRYPASRPWFARYGAIPGLGAFFGLLIGLVLGFRTLVYEPFYIPSSAMQPTLLVGDYVFVAKFAYGYSSHSLPFSLQLFKGRLFQSLPERGDIAVFKLPSDDRTDYIKRIVGLPGDRIQVREGILYVNDAAVERVRLEDFRDDDPSIGPVPRYRETLPSGRSYAVLDLTPDGVLDNTRGYRVPDGRVFAIGDNRDNSVDSRVDNVGFVPLKNLIGRADLVLTSTKGGASWPTTPRFSRPDAPL